MPSTAAAATMPARSTRCGANNDDELVRTDAGWRVAKRIYTCAISEGPAGITSKAVSPPA